MYIIHFNSQKNTQRQKHIHNILVFLLGSPQVQNFPRIVLTIRNKHIRLPLLALACALACVIVRIKFGGYNSLSTSVAMPFGGKPVLAAPSAGLQVGNDNIVAPAPISDENG